MPPDVAPKSTLAPTTALASIAAGRRPAWRGGRPAWCGRLQGKAPLHSHIVAALPEAQAACLSAGLSSLSGSVVRAAGYIMLHSVLIIFTRTFSSVSDSQEGGRVHWSNMFEGFGHEL
jgi:hypothetical protein